MSGWLALTQPGLAPGQKHQASLGALTTIAHRSRDAIKVERNS